jgi:hypothetical protein
MPEHFRAVYLLSSTEAAHITTMMTRNNNVAN